MFRHNGDHKLAINPMLLDGTIIKLPLLHCDIACNV